VLELRLLLGELMALGLHGVDLGLGGGLAGQGLPRQLLVALRQRRLVWGDALAGGLIGHRFAQEARGGCGGPRYRGPDYAGCRWRFGGGLGAGEGV
jgi:hypothetical protein